MVKGVLTVMKMNKLVTSLMAGAMVLSLAACGNSSKSTSSSKDTAESSKVTKSKKHTSKKSSSSKAKSSSSSKKTSASSSTASSKSSTSNSAQSSTSKSGDNSVVTSNTSSAKNETINSVKNSATASSVSSRQTPTMTSTDAKNLVKEHLSNQRANALEAGQGEPTQPSVDSVDGFTTTQNGTNDWTVTGSYGGKTYTYHVTPSAITGN